MPSLPDSLAFLRPYIHRIRMKLRTNPVARLLAGKSLRPTDDQAGDLRVQLEGLKSQFLNLLDRQAVMESSFNWRLHGVPSRVENISLEQMPVLSGAGGLKKALESLRSSERLPPELLKSWVGSLPTDSKVFFVESFSKIPRELLIASKPKQVFAIRDPLDLFLPKVDALADPGSHEKWQTISAPLLDAASLLAARDFDSIWLSAAVERLTPIQIQCLFSYCKEGLQKGGSCRGYFADFINSDPGLYWMNPMRLRPLTEAVVEGYARNAGFTSVTFEKDTGTKGISFVAFDLR